ncbi:hypothetical protein H6781_00560 [Candidatus Nomurabacteria bacterium]|nr:hypothetical protein [Candidatus Kaiserbacteria bacterium]MCB9810074.1 hypothetical protein [Candidatus Nomurabacteria bacterium]
MTVPEHVDTLEILRESFFSADSITAMINDPRLEWEEIIEITDSKEQSICAGMDYDKFLNFLKLILVKANFQEFDYSFAKELKNAKRIVDDVSGRQLVKEKDFTKIIREVLLCARVKSQRLSWD